MKKEHLISYVVTVFENSIHYHYENIYVTGFDKFEVIDKMQDHFDNKIKPAFKGSASCAILNIIEL